MIKTIPVAPGITLRAMQTDKFKTACFSVNFLRPHTAADAAFDALLPSVLLRATERYPDIRSISMQLDALYGASLGTLIRRKGEVKLMGFYADFIEDRFLPEGESVFDVLQRVCCDNGIQMEASRSPKYNSAYVEGIANLYEFDVGEGSGWMYKVNGWFPNYGCSGYTLSQGDVICWVYTCNLGDDVGGGYAT